MKKTFTVVEMLAVLVLMCALLALTIPAFRGMMQGGGVDAAARGISAQLRLARTEAVASRKRVAWLQLSPDSYAFCYVSRGLQFDGWPENATAILLPRGVVYECTLPGMALPVALSVPVVDVSAGSTATTAACIPILPSGRLPMDAAATIRVYAVNAAQNARTLEISPYSGAVEWVE